MFTSVTVSVGSTLGSSPTFALTAFVLNTAFNGLALTLIVKDNVVLLYFVPSAGVMVAVIFAVPLPTASRVPSSCTFTTFSLSEV